MKPNPLSCYFIPQNDTILIVLQFYSTKWHALFKLYSIQYSERFDQTGNALHVTNQPAAALKGTLELGVGFMLLLFC